VLIIRRWAVRDLDWALIWDPPKQGSWTSRGPRRFILPWAFSGGARSFQGYALTIATDGTFLAQEAFAPIVWRSLADDPAIASFFLGGTGSCFPLERTGDSTLPLHSLAYSSRHAPGAMTGLAGGRSLSIHFCLASKSLIEATT